MNELLQKSFAKGMSYVDLKKSNLQDVEMGQEMGNVDAEKNLAHFFEEVEQIKGEMERVKELLVKLQDTNEECKTVHRAQTMKTLRDRMDKDIALVSKVARSIRTKLEELDKANLVSRKNPGTEAGTPTDRTRMAITSTLRKKLKDLMGEFQSLRQRVMGEYRDTIERRYFTITGEKPDEDTIEKIIETGESENFLQVAIHEQGRGQILETIREIQERHDTVKEIEKNLLELHQIFLDMAVLVEAQGEQLNDIESQVNNAANYVARGTGQLKTAKNHQRNTRKWVCIGIILLLLLILLVIVPVAKSIHDAAVAASGH
ncbi:unnamed protein product [Sphagnum tenellum]